MCEQHKKAFVHMRRFISERKRRGESFTVWDIERHVAKNAQTTRIAPGRSIRDWIEDAKERGKLVEVAPLEYIVK